MNVKVLIICLCRSPIFLQNKVEQIICEAGIFVPRRWGGGDMLKQLNDVISYIEEHLFFLKIYEQYI